MSPDNRYLFTSESVSMGHPDKVADQISDGILDAILAQDPTGRVACETLLTTGLVVLAGEVTTTAMVDYPSVVRQVVREIGYTSSDDGLRRHDLRRDGGPGQAVARHRPGRRRRRLHGQGHRRRRPGPDVRLRDATRRPS